MAIADQLIFRVLPQAGQTQITNHLNGQAATGTGTPTLIDIGAEKAWSVAAGTLLNIPIPSTAITGDNGITIAIRARVTNFGTLSAQNFMGVNSAAGASLFESAHIRRNSTANNLAARYATGLIVNPSTVTFLNTVVTMISETEMSSVSSQDFGRVWVTGGGATEPNPDFSSTAGNGNATTVANFYINCSDGAAYEILDIAVFSGELTDAENWSLRQDIRATLPAAGGTAPTGTVTIGIITPNSTGATVPFTYSAADQAGFEYRLNGGSAVAGTTSPQVLTGLTPSTAYTIEIRAVNASGQGAWSTAANFTTSAAGSPPAGTFTIGAITTTQTTASVPYTYSAADFDSIEYRIDGGTPVTASASPQSLTGLTSATTYGIEFRAVNAFGNGAWSTSAPFTTAAATATFTTGVLRRLVGGAPLVNTAMTYFRLYNPTTGALVLNRTDLSSDANGRVTCTDAALTAGAEYKADWLAATGETRMSKKAAT